MEKRYSSGKGVTVPLPPFQSVVKAGIQGALNPKARLEFLTEYLNELIRPKCLIHIINDPAILQFLDLQSKRPYNF